VSTVVECMLIVMNVLDLLTHTVRNSIELYREKHSGTSL